MAQKVKDEIIFAGSGLDVDSDIRFFRKGDTDERWNLIPSGEGKNHVLSVVNGNYEVSNASLNLDDVMTNPVVVGSCYDSSTNMHYYLLCDDNGVQAILRYDVNNDEIERVLVPTTELAYGSIYNWHVINNEYYSIAPSGWHVPTKADFETLILNAGGTELGGGALKSTGGTQWISPNTGATNSTGFSAHAAGVRNANEYADYDSAGISTVLWCAEEEDVDYAYGLYLTYNSAQVLLSGVYEKGFGLSIRLIRDDDSGWVEGEQITDEDGNVYDTVQIEDQIWMVQNWASTKYADGTDIPNVEAEADWIEAYTNGDDGVSVYNNKPFYVRLEHLFNNLGLSQDVLIDDACVIGDHLFWNPKTSSPRMLNIKWALNLMAYLHGGIKATYNTGDRFYYKGRVYELTEDGVTKSELIEDIIGSVPSDITPTPVEPPYVLSAVVEDASPSDMVITFSSALDEGSVPATSAFSISGSTATINNVDVTGSVVTLTIDEEFVWNEALVVYYTKPGSNMLLGTGSEEVNSFSYSGVVNNVLRIPEPQSASVEADFPDKVVIVFDVALDESEVPNTSTFTLTDKTISDVDVSGVNVTLTVTEEYEGGETITVDYTGALPYLQSALGKDVIDFSDFPVTNNVSVPYDFSLPNPIFLPFSGATTYSFTVENIVPEGAGETFSNNFRHNFRCYVSDGAEYTNNFATSGIYNIIAGDDEVVVCTYTTPLPYGIRTDRQMEIYIWYDQGVDDWAQLGHKIWNSGL